MIPTMVYVVIRACYRIHNVVNSVGLPFILQQEKKLVFLLMHVQEFKTKCPFLFLKVHEGKLNHFSLLGTERNIFLSLRAV